MQVTLEDIIRQYVKIPARANGQGFYSVLCKVCHDHGRKGLRAGFKFDGNAVGYNCFNCGHTAVYDPAEDQYMPNKMKTVLSAFGIPEVEWRKVLLNQPESVISSRKQLLESIEPPTIPMLSIATKLANDDNEISQYAIEYLHGRGIDWTTYPFYIVNTLTDHPDAKRWYGRLIIPVYKDNRLVFYQGRDLSDTLPKKYLSPNVSRENIIYGYDKLKSDESTPLYITEGWFDAQVIDGISVFHHKLTPNQIRWINQSPREKVVIPDRYGDGHLLAQQAIRQGWCVSYPDIGSCNDVSAAVQKYGLLYTLRSIHDNTCSGFAAESRLYIYCERNYNG